MTQEEFQAALMRIQEQAEAQNRSIDQASVRAFFEGEDLSEEQMSLVFDYLLSRRIRVKGYAKKTAGSEEKKECSLPAAAEKVLKEYTQQLSVYRAEKKGEWADLLPRLKRDDAAAWDRLMELFLKKVPDIVRENYTSQIPIGDQLQEGSAALLQALSDPQLKEGVQNEKAASPSDSVYNSRTGSSLKQEIVQAITALSEEQKDIRQQNKHMVSRVEDFKDSVAILKEEMGRKVYLDEVADFMSISEEEAESILKLTGDEISGEEE